MESFVYKNQKDKKEMITEKIKQVFYSLPHEVITPKRGEIIFHQGNKVEKLGFIVEGVMTCSKFAYNGDKINTHYFYAGDIFPEYLLLTGENKYIYNLVTEKNAKLLLINASHMRELLLQDIKWNNLIIEYMAWRGLNAEKWSLCNCYSTLKSRIAYMLLEIKEIEENQWTKISDSQKVIASKLHVSRPMYNQELIKMEREGLIKRNGQNMMLVNREKLETYF